METSSPDFGDGGVLGWLKKAFDPTAMVTGGMASPSLKGDEIRKPTKAAPASSPAPVSTGSMSTYETPYGTVQAPSLEAAQKFIKNEKAKRTPFENDAGQMVLPSGQEVAPPSRPDRIEGQDVTGSILPLKIDAKTGKLAFAVPEIIAAPLRGAEQGGRDLLGRGRTAFSDVSPETKAAVAALATGLRFGRPGPAAAPVPTGMSSLSRQAINTGIEPNLRQRIGNQFAQGIGLPNKGVNAFPNLQQIQANAVDVVRDIVANKDNLQLTHPTGETVTGRLPSSVQQFSEAIDNRKDALFNDFNAMAKDADTSHLDPSLSPINKFRANYQEAALEEARTRRELAAANNRVTMVLARQSQSPLGAEKGARAAMPEGSPLYYSEAGRNTTLAQAQAQLKKAERAYSRGQQRVVAAREDATKPWVDLKPVASELSKVADDAPTRMNNESIANYAGEMASKYGKQEAYSAQEAQRAIKQLNASLKAFYDNPSYDTAAKASVDAMIANQLRAGLDRMVTQATGPGYQRLKNLYGAYSSLEKQVTRAAIKGMNKNESDFLNRFFNVTSGEELLRGVLSMNPAAIGRGLLLRVAKGLERSRNSPDRTIENMFRDAERGFGFGRSMDRFDKATTPPAPPAPPKIGDRGPMGGTLTNVQSYKAPLP